MGLGQIYVNLQGREGHGIVEPGRLERRPGRARRSAPDDDRSDDRRADGGRRLQTRRHLQGPFLTTRRSCRSASPTAIAFRGSRRSAAHRRASSIPNMKKWSGDHGSFDYKQTAGVLISSRPLADGRRGHHGYRAHRIEVLRRADTQ